MRSVLALGEIAPSVAYFLQKENRMIDRNFWQEKTGAADECPEGTLTRDDWAGQQRQIIVDLSSCWSSSHAAKKTRTL